MTRKANTRGSVGFPASLLLAGVSPAAAQEPLRMEPIVTSGDAAPGLTGVTFLETDAAWLNRAGRVAFWARLDGGTLTNLTDQSAWVADGGALSLAAAAGQAAPGSNGRLVSAIGQVAMDDHGRVVVLANLDDGVTPYSLRQAPLFTLFGVSAAGQGSLIAAENALLTDDPAPAADPANRLVNTVIWAAASDDGVLAFDGWTDDGVLTPWLPGVVALTVDGRMLVSDVTGAPVVGPGGDVVFRMSFTDAVPDTANPDLVVNALMFDAANEPTPLVLFANVPEPALPSVEFADIAGQIVLSADGDVVFRAKTRGAAALHGVWTWADGALTPVVQEGDEVPGSTTDLFGSFAGGPAMNLHGDIAVRGTAEPADMTAPRPGLWCFPVDGDAWEIARAGAAAPVAPDATYVHLTDATVTDAGRVVFVAGIAGSAVGEYTQTALVARSREGGATVLARTGAEMLLGGVPGVIRSVVFAGGRNPDGGRQLRSYGAADQIVFEVLLEDDRSALVRATVGLAADYDHSGVVDLHDLLQYVNLWFASSARADLAGPVAIDVFDLLAYLDCWFAGVEGGDCL